MRKRIISLFLVFAMCAAFFASPALANGEKVLKDGQPVAAQSALPERLSKDGLDTSRLSSETSPDIVSGEYSSGYKYDSASSLWTEIDENETLYVIVELKSEPLGESAALLSKSVSDKSRSSLASSVVKRNAELKAEQSSVMSGLNKTDKDAKILASYTAVMNGFATEIQYKDIKTLKNDSRVKNVYYSQAYDRPEPNDAASLSMVYASSAWGLGYRGDGMLIAILDTGVDYNHELLSALSSESKITEEEMVARVAAAGQLNATLGSYYKNDKVIFGYDYADVDEDPMDIRGHGTHVAGIAAANVSEEGVVMGVAPNAQIMAMKVFSDSISYTYDHWVIAALDDAIKLGVDSVNLSLGSGAGFTSYGDLDEFTYGGCFKNARATGAIVNCSAGNEGYMGTGAYLGVSLPYTKNPDYGLVGSPSTTPEAISVASNDNISYYQNYLFSNEKKIAYADTNSVPFAETLDGQTLTYVAVPGLGAPEDYAGLDLTGKVALISRGSLSFVEKANNAKAAGAVAAVVYNNTTGSINMALDGAEIPAVSISQTDGAALAALGTGTMSFSGEYLDFFENLDTSGLISSFSSYGPTPDLKIKPEITAPGGGIFSTIPDGYGNNSGTSMAAPHVTGGSAIVKQYLRKYNSTLSEWRKMDEATIAERTDNLLMSTARILTDEYGNPYSVQAQGAGLMDLKGAVSADAFLYNAADHESKVELGDKLDPNSFTVEFKLQSSSNSPRQYDISAILMADDYGVLGAGGDTIAFDMIGSYVLEPTVKILVTKDSNGNTISSTGKNFSLYAMDTYTVKVTFSISEEDHAEWSSAYPNGYFVDGFVKVTPQVWANGSFDLSIPFLGFVGDWLDAPAIDPLSIYEDVYRLDDVPFYWENLGAYCDYFWGIWEDWYIAGENIWSGNLGPADHVTFSPNNDNYSEKFSAQVDFLRNLKNIWVEIIDKDGNVVRTIDTEESYFNKSYYYSNGGYVLSHFLPEYGLEWDGTDDEGNIVPEGFYTYSLAGVLDYPGAEEKPHRWGLDVMLDVTAPEVEYAFREDAGRYFVDISASDNHYLALIAVGDNNNLYAGTTFTGYSEYGTSFEVTELVAKYGSAEAAKKHILVYVEDYAQNVFGEYLIPQPQITGFYVSPVYYVSGLAANVRVEVQGRNLDGAELTAFVTDMWDPVTEIITINPGTGIYRISAMPEVTSETRFYFDLYVNGEYIVSDYVRILPLPDDIWTPIVNKTDSALQVVFSAGAQLTLKDGAKVTLGSQSYTYTAANPGIISVEDNIISIAGKQDYEGKFSISGVKFPVLFPSYSFTFTLDAAPK